MKPQAGDDDGLALGHFPGYQAGASLKLRGGRRVGGRPNDDFPGYQAGASLKPGRPAEARSLRQTSPVTKPGPH